MTKKKALIYFVIFIFAIIGSYLFRISILEDPSVKLTTECKMVVSTQCQQYVMKLSSEKKYEEAVKIQKIRIKENENILKFYKSKLKNKCLLKMDTKEVQAALAPKINEAESKDDYFIIKTADFTLKDIVIDSLAVSQIQYSELKDKKAAIKTLKHAQKLVNKNKYMQNRELMLKLIDKELSEVK